VRGAARTGVGPGLVVFDCDGVLVDSERLAIRVEAEVLCELGWEITEAEVAERFVGTTLAEMLREVEAVLGRPVSWDQFEARHRATQEAELGPVPGALDVVTTLLARGTPMCVASNSLPGPLAYKLELAGLASYFEGRAFSIEDVVHGKPAPDLFLHAARTLGVDASACVVVEDSPSGVAAAKAAGMAVFAYAGGVVPASRLEAPGVTVFDDMAELVGLLDAVA
jgi:HAD superfamily hydrolase (TIGR01509 family)